MGKSKYNQYVQQPTPAYQGPPGVYAQPQYGPYAPPPVPMAQAYSAQPMYQSTPTMTVYPGQSRRDDDGCCAACCGCLLGLCTALCCCPCWI